MEIRDAFLSEYTNSESIKRYVKASAGTGIDYLLEAIYAPIYQKAIDTLSLTQDHPNGWRILEYGCGGGMNLIRLVKLLAHNKLHLDAAYGTDFSPEMVATAGREASTYLSADQAARLHFAVASNENLSTDLAESLRTPRSSLMGSINLALGVNTFRYCHRLNRADESARDIFDLLVKGGISIMIDMNKRFPLFRSRFRRRTLPRKEYYLPSLEEYKGPFERAGFHLLEVRNFCWVPHSATGLEFRICKALNPFLDRVAPSFAMRSLVVAQKPLSLP